MNLADGLIMLATAIFFVLAALALIVGYEMLVVPAMMNCPPDAHVCYIGCSEPRPACCWDNCTISAPHQYACVVSI
jgi:hypothetical protein